MRLIHMPRWLRALLRLLIAVWFRRVEVVGVSRLPPGRPLVVVANHGNGLVDAFLLAARLPRALHFLAKSTLWDNPVLGLLLSMGRSIPVHRREDAGGRAGPSRNPEALQQAAAVLTNGGAVAIFPEGRSHNEPAVQPLKTGAARIALSGPPNTCVVPVGLRFEAKDRFRGRALFVVGEPITARSGTRGEMAERARRLTGEIAEALRLVMAEASALEPGWDAPRDTLAWVARAVVMAVNAPLALFGAALHLLPCQVPRWFAGRRSAALDEPASYKLLTGLFVFPAWWSLLSGCAYGVGGFGLAVVVLFTAPAAAWVALRWREEGAALQRSPVCAPERKGPRVKLPTGLSRPSA